MKKINSRGNCPNLLTALLVLAATLFGTASCERYDLEERTPEWLGASIYEYLKDNHYDTYVKLINDLNYKDILMRTGSKTLFVADEDAFSRFYQSGVFKKADGTPVRGYEDLSLAQKKMLLYGSMLNNVYQVAMLSSTEGTPPLQGDCMRRIVSSSIWDSVPFMKPQSMPSNKYWNHLRSGDGVYIMTDETNKPMVFFTYKFLQMKKIQNSDYDFLFNQGEYSRGKAIPAYQPGDASVNGSRIKEQNIKCFNGFVHVMEDVIYPLPNMAEYLRTNPNTSKYSSLLERFSAPYYQFGSLSDDGKTMRDEFNRLYGDSLKGTYIDTLYQMRFFSKRSHDGASAGPLETDAYGKSANGVLKFDPAWNTYYSATSSTTTSNVAMQQNMGVMLVPSDAAMDAWWNSSETGKVNPLKERYQVMDSIPDDVIVKLLNNNMLNSFVSSVPSKFATVLDDANDPMGIKPENIDSVKMCCNGAVYFTNVVFSPTAYRSVSFPTLVNDTLKIINWAIDNLGFDAYLNSMVAEYSFFVPKSQVVPGVSDYPSIAGRPVLLYLDPVSAANKYTQLFAFYYDEKAPLSERVKAEIFNYDLVNQSVGEWIRTASIGNKDKGEAGEVIDRLEDILDYHIVIGDVRDKYTYYQTKGRGTVKVDVASNHVWGGFQSETSEPATISTIYDMTTLWQGNGVTYMIDEPLLTSYNTVYDVITDQNRPKFNEFYNLMSGFFQNERNGHAMGGDCLSTFNTYHYTVYVPSSESLNKAYQTKEILNWTMIDELEEYYQTLAEDSAAYRTAMIRLSKALRTDIVKKLKQDKYLSCQIWNESDNNYSAFWKEAVALLDAEATTDDDLAYEYGYYVNAGGAFTDQTTGKVLPGVLDGQLNNFVKYHIQDNSVYYGGELKMDSHSSDPYAHFETAYMNSRSQFEKLAVKSDDSGITVVDYAGITHKVLTDDAKYYNNMCREIEYDANRQSAKYIETSSFAVVHLIDSPLNNGIEFTYYKF